MFISFERFKKFSDRELILAYRNSLDERYLSELFHRYTYLVFFLCNRYFENREEADDSTIEIFAKISSQILEIEIVNFKSWLYQITKNFCLDKISKYNSIQCEFISISEGHENLFMQFQSFDRLMDTQHEQFELLEDAVKRLDSDQKESVKLFYYKKKSYHEIMEMKKWDMDQLRSHLQNARRNIRIYLEKKGGINEKSFEA